MLGLTKRLRRSSKRRIPYRMFDTAYFGVEARNASILERVYHKSQRRSWDGKKVFAALIEEHGRPELPKEQRDALGRVFAIILWGELAAWKISAELSDEIEPLEAKLAATSQAFDEARHFYVMHDYLTELGALPDKLDWGAQTLLEEVMNASNLAKKLMGMQLMVEPIALTLFHIVKKLDIEPVLTGLMPYYEKDEARHVALGIQYMPTLMKQLSPLERVDLFAFQLRLITLELFSNYGVQRDMALLGIDPRDLLAVGKAKQLKALEMMMAELGEADNTVPSLILDRYADLVSEMTMPLQDRSWASVRARLSRLWTVARHGADAAADLELVPDIPDEHVPLMNRDDDDVAA